MSRVLSLALRSLALIFLVTSFVGQARAQQITIGDGTGGNGALCSGGGKLAKSVTDDCGGAQAFVQSLSFGPSGQAVTLDASNPGGGVLTIGSGIKQTTLDAASGNVSVGGSFFINSSSQTVDMGGARVQSVGSPISGTDAANKNYVDGVNTTQNTRLTNIETVNTQQDTRLTTVEAVNTQQNTRLASLETATTTQGDAIAGLNSQVSTINSEIQQLTRRDEELASGIAISLALDQPVFLPGQSFAMRAGYGNFDGADAFGLTIAGVLAKNFAGSTSSLVVDGGVGTSTSTDMVAGKAGITLGW